MAVAEQNRDCGNEKHGKTPDAKNPRQSWGGNTLVRELFTLGSVFLAQREAAYLMHGLLFI